MRDADAPHLAAPEWTELAECSNDRSDRITAARDLATPRRPGSRDPAALHAETSSVSVVGGNLCMLIVVA
jgi:hypothetical protein